MMAIMTFIPEGRCPVKVVRQHTGRCSVQRLKVQTSICDLHPFCIAIKEKKLMSLLRTGVVYKN
jgi:hypothetical protein